MLEGRLFKNEHGRYQIKGINFYFTCGDYIELFDEETLEWLVGSIEYDCNHGYYTIVTVKGWCCIEQQEEIYNLEGWIARGFN